MHIFLVTIYNRIEGEKIFSKYFSKIFQIIILLSKHIHAIFIFTTILLLNHIEF